MARKILIVKMSSMGDVVHAQPLACDLRRQFPDDRIDWVVEPSFRAICDANAAIDAVWTFPWRKWRRQLRDPQVRLQLRQWVTELRAARHDVVIDCQGLFKSAMVARLTQAPLRIGPDLASARERWSRFAYNHTVRVPTDRHVVWRNRAHGALGLDYPLDEPADFGLSAEQLRRQVPAEVMPPEPYVLLVTGASREEKLWPEAHWVELASRLAAMGWGLVWFWGSDEERERVERLAGQLNARPEPVVQHIPPFLKVDAAMGVIAGARAVVGLDTGFTHIAGALGRDTVGIYCDFDPVQCAVSGAGICSSLGGIGVTPTLEEVWQAVGRIFAEPVS